MHVFVLLCRALELECVCVWSVCVSASFHHSHETRWSRQFKFELLKGCWQQRPQVRSLSDHIPRLGTLVLCIFLQRPKKKGSTCPHIAAAARSPSHSHFKSSQHSFSARLALSPNISHSKEAFSNEADLSPSVFKERFLFLVKHKLLGTKSFCV